MIKQHWTQDSGKKINLPGLICFLAAQSSISFLIGILMPSLLCCTEAIFLQIDFGSRVKLVSLSIVLLY
jgi:hypothetical protein